MTAIDLQGIPTHACVCGCNTFVTAVRFHEYEIAWYTTQGKCYECGSNVTLPTPADRLEPATINLTCPLCENDAHTVILQDDEPTIAKCERCTYLYVAT
jgi:Zn finger protein HypA/HybF involved in hydrogenase expression